MSFTSISFLFYSLPLSLLLYRLSPERLRRYVLIGISLLFYAWMKPIYALYLLFFISYAYLGAKWISREADDRGRVVRTWILCLFLIFLLLYFKYADLLYDAFLALVKQPFLVEAWAMPLGASFLLFSLMSYLIDIAKQRCYDTSLISCALYLSFFPKLIMGPIMPYHRFMKENTAPVMSWSLWEQGTRRFTLGLAQKLILADSFAMLYSYTCQDASVLGSWLSSLSYTLQILFDFAGYSAMAIGIAMMFGYRLMENFDHPYRACSIREFWRRWHISLSAWFRDYVYIPLGGNRVSTLRHIRNILIVWLLTGLWHGSSLNFLLWGFYYGCLLLIEAYVFPLWHTHLPKWLANLITFFLVHCGWVIFAHQDIGAVLTQFQSMFAIHTAWYSSASVAYLISYALLLMIALVIIFVPFTKLKQKLQTLSYYAWLETGAYTALLLLSVGFLLASHFQSFLYFQF